MIGAVNLQKGRDPIDKFIPKEKMSKKGKKKIAAEQRGIWAFSPVTRKIDSKKLYNRKRISRARNDDSTRDSFLFLEIMKLCPRSSTPYAV